MADLKIPNFQKFHTYRLRCGQTATIVSFRAKQYSSPKVRMLAVIHTPDGDIMRRYNANGKYIGGKFEHEYDILPDDINMDIINEERVEDVLLEVRKLLMVII